MQGYKSVLWGTGFVASLLIESIALGQDGAKAVPTAPRKIGGFACVDLKPYKNDATFDLYRIGAWSFSGFSQDLWKRHGVPFWYPRGLGDIRVAGPRWTPQDRAAVSSAECGGIARADHQQPDNGAIAHANDDDLSTYWYAGDNRPHGRLSIDLKTVEHLASVRFLGWATGRHAPKDYRIGVILPDGTEKDLASVADEKRLGRWIGFNAKGIAAKGLYLEVTSTVDNEHGPVVFELQARTASPRKSAKKHDHAAEVLIPLAGLGAEELFVLGNVAAGRGEPLKTGTTVGRYVVTYESGSREIIPLVAGKNVADTRYGSFVPEAEPAFMMPDLYSAEAEEAVPLSYHLDDMLPVEPKKQLMMFGHRLAQPGKPLRSLAFSATDPETALYLAAVTLRQSGPRMNALFYNGKMVDPIPPGTPRVAPSILDRQRDPRKTLSLDGAWRYRTDPGNEGIRAAFFAVDHDLSTWKTMPVPSQWYVHGLDYHGVVWFRKDFTVPADFPGPAAELCFDGVDYDARVWLNGKYVGRHIGAYAAFTLDAADALRKGAVNTIVVRVDSPLDPGFTTQKTIIKGNAMDDIAMPYAEEGCMGGIFRPVRLQGRGDVGIEDAWTQTALSKDLKHAEVKVRFALRPRQAKPEELTVVCSLKQPDGLKNHSITARRMLAPASATAVELTLSIDDPKLWYPWEQGEPYLYLLEIEVRRGDHLLDRHVSRAGIREIGFDATTHCVSVNHHRIFLKGFLNDDVHWMSLMDRSGYRQRLQMQKDAGVNTIRVVTHQSSPEMYDLCNEMGMMLWQEMPLQWGYSTSSPIRDDILKVVRETVVQCRPHPCVVGWSAWNEGGQRDFSAKVVSLMQSLDSSRPMSRASGGGDWDVHHYTNLNADLGRCTPLWCGVTFGFVSEVGSYGLPSPEDMHSMLGPELFRFGSAEYYWDTFNHYRHQDGPLFLDSPLAADWPAEKIQQYVLAKQPASERWLWQYMKFMFENFRGQRFAPTTAALHCRFDDSFPSAHMAVVGFNGRPRKAYFSTKEALQPVLPILFFDTTGAEDLRVVNEYWHRSWAGCSLQYTLKTRDGKIVRRIERKFDLPADSTVKVLTRNDVGDVWHMPGFFAELQVAAPGGSVLSRNHYDLTADEIRDFVTNVYPAAPVTPIDGVLLRAADAAGVQGPHRRMPAKGAYSASLLELGGGEKGCAAEYEVQIPKTGHYLIRVACQSGEALGAFELGVDGVKPPREHVPYLNMAAGITRRPYSDHQISWRPGWHATLQQGAHKLSLKRPEGARGAPLLLDAICVQPSRK